MHISLKPRDHHARDKLTVNVTEKRLEPNNVTEKRLEPKKWRGGGGGVVLLSAGKIAELCKMLVPPRNNDHAQ